jgi:hypothetical protein
METEQSTEVTSGGSNTKYYAVGAAVLALIVLAGVAMSNDDKKETAMQGDESMMQSEGAATGDMNGDAEGMNDMRDDSEGMATGATAVAGSYEAYSSEKLAMAESGDVVLFFHASWCPTCRAADSALESETLPEGLTVLKVDYDSASDLRQAYGVTSQHTFVQVDTEGNLIKKWTGSRSTADIQQNLL